MPITTTLPFFTFFFRLLCSSPDSFFLGGGGILFHSYLLFSFILYRYHRFILFVWFIIINLLFHNIIFVMSHFHSPNPSPLFPSFTFLSPFSCIFLTTHSFTYSVILTLFMRSVYFFSLLITFFTFKLVYCLILAFVMLVSVTSPFYCFFSSVTSELSHLTR